MRQVISEEASATVRKILESRSLGTRKFTGLYRGGLSHRRQAGTSTKTTEEIAGNKIYRLLHRLCLADDGNINTRALGDPAQNPASTFPAVRWAAPVSGEDDGGYSAPIWATSRSIRMRARKYRPSVPEVAGMSLAEAQRALTETASSPG